MLLENKELATIFSVCKAEIFPPKENHWTAFRCSPYFALPYRNGPLIGYFYKILKWVSEVQGFLLVIKNPMYEKYNRYARYFTQH